jgi:hypothetical protein
MSVRAKTRVVSAATNRQTPQSRPNYPKHSEPHAQQYYPPAKPSTSTPKFGSKDTSPKKEKNDKEQHNPQIGSQDLKKIYRNHYRVLLKISPFKTHNIEKQGIFGNCFVKNRGRVEVAYNQLLTFIGCSLLGVMIFHQMLEIIGFLKKKYSVNDSIGELFDFLLTR